MNVTGGVVEPWAVGASNSERHGETRSPMLDQFTGKLTLTIATFTGLRYLFRDAPRLLTDRPLGWR